MTNNEENMSLFNSPEFCKIFNFLKENNFDQAFNLKFYDDNATFQVEVKTEYDHFDEYDKNPVLLTISRPYNDGTILYLFKHATSSILHTQLRKAIAAKTGNAQPVIYFHMNNQEETTREIECNPEWVIPILEMFMKRVTDKFNLNHNQNSPNLIATLLFIDEFNDNPRATMGPALIKFITLEKERMLNNLILATSIIPFLSVDLALVLAMTHEDFKSFDNIEDLPVEVLFSLFR